MFSFISKFFSSSLHSVLYYGESTLFAIFRSRHLSLQFRFHSVCFAYLRFVSHSLEDTDIFALTRVKICFRFASFRSESKTNGVPYFDVLKIQGRNYLEFHVCNDCTL
jgi:hypothetical protein